MFDCVLYRTIYFVLWLISEPWLHLLQQRLLNNAQSNGGQIFLNPGGGYGPD